MFRLAVALVMFGLYCEAYKITDFFYDSELTCEDSDYDPETHLCCNGKLRKIFNNRNKCCGDGTYNPDTHICCGTTKHYKNRYGAESKCCVNQIYNPKYVDCCGENDLRRKGSCEK